MLGSVAFQRKILDTDNSGISSCSFQIYLLLISLHISSPLSGKKRILRLQKNTLDHLNNHIINFSLLLSRVPGSFMLSFSEYSLWHHLTLGLLPAPLQSTHYNFRKYSKFNVKTMRLTAIISSSRKINTDMCLS